MILGIDGSNIKSDGGIVHLSELINNINKKNQKKISQIILWGDFSLLSKIKISQSDIKDALADQLPFGSTAPPETENPVETLSIKKVRLGERGFPFLSTIPLPLLEVRFPDTSMKSPAVGFAVMGLNDMEVGDLTIMVLMNVKYLLVVHMIPKQHSILLQMH